MALVSAIDLSLRFRRYEVDVLMVLANLVF